MNPFWSIVYFWEMTRFWWNFWWRSGPITSFFCTYFQVHRTCFKKVKSKNAFFHFFKNVKKHIHDAKNSSSHYWHYGFSSDFGFFLLIISIFSEVLIDETFNGTAMEALGQFLIPFPYKVAKCLDPHTYRNIEFDVWNCQQNEERQQRIKDFQEQRARQAYVHNSA